MRRDPLISVLVTYTKFKLFIITKFKSLDYFLLSRFYIVCSQLFLSIKTLNKKSISLTYLNLF